MSANSEAGPSKRRRQYASRACNGCRRRRCKCDGVQPTCGTCAHTGHECSWSLEGDARRPATKQLVESLRVKIHVLEAEVARLKDLPGQSDDPSSSPALASVPNIPPPNPVVAPVPQIPIELRALSTGGVVPSPPNVSGSSRTPDPFGDRPLPAPTAQFTSTALYRYIFEIDQSVQMSEQPTDVRLSLVCDWRRYLPDLEPVHLSREEHDTILARGFKYGTSWLLGLVPELFLHDMLFALTSPSSSRSPSPSSSPSTPTSQQSPLSVSQTRLHHYTPLLHCALLAFACAFAPSPALRLRAVRAKFAVRAKRWLDDEFNRPVMSLVPALALLAEYHCGVGERDTGYMYMGMSIRAARALISSDARESWVGQGMVAYPDSIARDWHFWSTFAQEFGRPYDMPIPHMGISHPCIDTELDALPWPAETESPAQGGTTPDLSSADGGEGYLAVPASPGQGKATTAAFLESCKLMVIAARIVDFLGAGGSQGGKGLEDGTLMNLRLQLDTWFNNLPENFLVWARSSSPLPHTLVLHICYWSLIIHLHRPFYTAAQTTRIPAGNLSVKLCDRAAHKIVQLLGMFGDHYGLRLFPRNMIQAIYTSGIALLCECSNAPSGAVRKRATAHEGAATCVRALRAVGETWPCAMQKADELELLVGDQDGDGEDEDGMDMEFDELEEDMEAHGPLPMPIPTSVAAGKRRQVEPGTQYQHEDPSESEEQAEREAQLELHERFESEDRYEPHSAHRTQPESDSTANDTTPLGVASGSFPRAKKGPAFGVQAETPLQSLAYVPPSPYNQELQSHGSDFQQMHPRNVTAKIIAIAVPAPS
ncbi:hypothetical protein BDV93DRAFT_527295 [Ceratobasidium sp. AG-I]|nr:hypothetical protein BDV93DRAFT_527295 [Ceratobasidium sp. AG-I]